MKFIGLGQTLFRYWRMVNDPRTPKFVKFLVVGGIGFTLVPEKWLPEWMPQMGLKDDTAVIPSLIALSMLMIPKEVRESHDRAVLQDALAKQVEGGRTPSPSQLASAAR